MRLQMLLPSPDVGVIQKLDSETKEHLVAKTLKFKKTSEAKVLLAAQKNDQKFLEKHNAALAELEYQRMYLTTTNIIRAAIALGLKELTKLSNDQVIELARKHGVSRGRPNGG